VSRLWAVHKRLLEGLPSKSVIKLRQQLVALNSDDDLEWALGMSLQAIERLESTESRRLTPEESSRL